jgi:hypothetical protein
MKEVREDCMTYVLNIKGRTERRKRKRWEGGENKEVNLKFILQSKSVL